MKKILLVLLTLIAIVMIILGINANALPPVFTGMGFIIIAILFYNKK